MCRPAKPGVSFLWSFKVLLGSCFYKHWSLRERRGAPAFPMKLGQFCRIKRPVQNAQFLARRLSSGKTTQSQSARVYSPTPVTICVQTFQTRHFPKEILINS
jgi:hypothetical protein